MLVIDRGTVGTIYGSQRVVGNAADESTGISGWQDGGFLGTKEAV
jgi:hypothetical protein